MIVINFTIGIDKTTLQLFQLLLKRCMSVNILQYYLFTTIPHLDTALLLPSNLLRTCNASYQSVQVLIVAGNAWHALPVCGMGSVFVIPRSLWKTCNTKGLVCKQRQGSVRSNVQGHILHYMYNLITNDVFFKCKLFYYSNFNPSTVFN